MIVMENYQIIGKLLYELEFKKTVSRSNYIKYKFVLAYIIKKGDMFFCDFFTYKDYYWLMYEESKYASEKLEVYDEFSSRIIQGCCNLKQLINRIDFYMKFGFGSRKETFSRIIYHQAMKKIKRRR